VLFYFIFNKNKFMKFFFFNLKKKKLNQFFTLKKKLFIEPNFYSKKLEKLISQKNKFSLHFSLNNLKKII
jgi:hypothetical protein